MENNKQPSLLQRLNRYRLNTSEGFGDTSLGVGTLFLFVCAGLLYYEYNKFEVEEQKRPLVQKIFGNKSYADRNENGSISFAERADAYKRMRYEMTDIGEEEAQKMFPRPTRQQLEIAIESYQEERLNQNKSYH